MNKTSKIILCEGIKLDNSYKNVIDYDEEEMLALVNDKAVATGNNYTFVRQEKNVVQVPFDYNLICNCNYMAFQNKDYNNRWFYAFIRDIQYVNDGCTNIIFDIDVWSTFYNSLTIKQCFVEREHVNDDTIGANTIDEGISTGEMYQINNNSQLNDFGDNWVIIVETAYIPEHTVGGETVESKQYQNCCINTGIVSSTQYVIFAPLSMQDTDVLTCVVNMERFIDHCNQDGHIEDIKNVFFAPEVATRGATLQGCVGTLTGSGGETKTYLYYLPSSTYSPYRINFQLAKFYNWSDFTPKNNKCKVFPYYYLEVSNNENQKAKFRLERFVGQENCNFHIDNCLTLGGSTTLTPVGYNVRTGEESLDMTIPLAKYPTINWESDAYVNWLTQNGVSSFVGDILSILSGAAGSITSATNGGNGNIFGLVTGGISTIANRMQESHLLDLKTNLGGGASTGDVNFALHRNNYNFKMMRSDVEHLRIIDEYFSRIGYKVNRTKVPNITGRTYWNYIKIGQGEIMAQGNIQSKFLEVINNIAIQGVTIWHNHENIGNYSLNNTIV